MNKYDGKATLHITNSAISSRITINNNNSGDNIVNCNIDDG